MTLVFRTQHLLVSYGHLFFLIFSIHASVKISRVQFKKKNNLNAPLKK